MSTLLARIGGSTAAHPWRTVAAWVVAFVVAFGLAGAFGGTAADDYNVPGTESQAGTDLLVRHFPAQSGADARIVVHSEHGPVAASAVDGLRTRLAAIPHVAELDATRLSADGDTALVGVHYDVPVTEFQGTEGTAPLEAAGKPLQDAGLTVEYGGFVHENAGAPSGIAELVGIVAALIILVIAFGSALAAALPLVVALFGLGIGSAGVTLLASVTSMSTFCSTVASMVGLGVGIDYALLLVTRFAEGLKAGLDRRAAAARANATAGLSVILAGTTVLVSLLGLKLAGLNTYSTVGYATALVVLAIMIASVTLVPALCGLAGPRVLRKADRARVLAGDFVTGHEVVKETATHRWAAMVGRRPLAWALGALVVLLALAAPVLDMRTFPQDAGTEPTSNTVRRAYDLTAAEFGVGANGPMVVAVDTTRVSPAQLPGLTAALGAVPGVASTYGPVTSPDGAAALIVVEPTTSPDDVRTTALLTRIRADVLPDGTYVTGTMPVLADISAQLSTRLWLVVAFIVALSLLFLTTVFRSVVVAVKAALMNLLSVAAAYGLMVAVFQWGWGAELLGLPHAVPVSSWVPIMMFAILFGLSMDYEVFLLSRIREDYLATGDAHGSVIRGLASTGRVITSAAAIMVCVFLGFALDPGVVIKMIGVGLASAILIDATIVRMILVPSTMALLGRANWWLPGWLDRVLPHLDVEGAAPAEPAPVVRAEEEKELLPA
ncbi:MMPL family transporter [Spongisporangium articulatum]|uniref:MMPL family transporter n=1 Tax=Spongisporangium articulatum TaxID=3362603 RepID=A0ABW8AM28_9ACTN